MLTKVEDIALGSHLHFRSGGRVWSADCDAPHIATFRYELGVYKEDSEDLVIVGTVDGYRIAQDWTVESELEIWEEADSLDGDVVRYVEALIRELRACEVVFQAAPDLTTAQRITVVCHVDALAAGDLPDLTQAAVAGMAMMDAPVLMLVDPWPMSEARATPKGKLRGRANIPKLLELGFKRMVGSRFLWAWNRELGDTLMHEYSYETLRRAKREGLLEEVLKSPLAEEIYGELPQGVAQMVDLPEPSKLTEE